MLHQDAAHRSFIKLFFATLIPFAQTAIHLSSASAQTATNHASADTVFKIRSVPNPAFAVGEKLDFIVRYGPIVAGNARLSIPEAVEVNGRKCYRILSEAWSNSFFSKFYKVEDRIQSFTDVEGLFSWRFEKKQHEGSFRDEQFVEFDHRAGLAITTKKTKRDTVSVPRFVKDVLSAMYYIRTLDFAPGDSIFVDNHADNKVYPLKIVVYRKERVSTRAGKFECYVVEPLLKTPGLFQQKGRVVVHLTADHRKIPVLMTSQIYVKAFDLGSVVVELEKMEGAVGK
jgi:hypothetical protein